MESIKYFLYLLGLDPFWPIVIVILLGISGLFPYHLKGKSVTKKDKDGNEETKYFQYKEF